MVRIKRGRLSPPPPDLDEMVRSAAALADERGIRAAAREIGLSPSGLTKILNGNHPYAPTLKKLRRWHKTLGSRVEIRSNGFSAIVVTPNAVTGP